MSSIKDESNKLEKCYIYKDCVQVEGGKDTVENIRTELQ